MPEKETATLEGEIEKVVFSNEKQDYSVARFRLKANRRVVIIVGNLFGLVPGQPLKVHGTWIEHDRFGRQLRVDSVESEAPATLDGIYRFLSSGLIEGLGPELAKRIVKTFGLQTFWVLDNNPDLLRRVSGIGGGRVEKIKRQWRTHRQISEVIASLQSHGISASLAMKIYGAYGSRSIEVVRNQPYSLAADIYGIGFRKADEIARKTGLAPDSAQRVEAGLLHTLRELADEGHVCYPVADLFSRCAELLEVDSSLVQAALIRQQEHGRIVVEEAPELSAEGGESRVAYLSSLHAAEAGVALRLLELMSREPAEVGHWRSASQPEWRPAGFAPGPDQHRALGLILQSKLSVLTGGPGTGKTTLLKWLTAILTKSGLRVALAAPTGRASRRLEEATGSEAKTIHRLLEYAPGGAGFLRDRRQPLNVDCVVIDESSMVDTVLMYHLLNAIPDGARVLFVGDVDQLPPVGPGNVLRDMIESQVLPTARLTEVFRQAGESRIVRNAHRINSGQLPELPAKDGGLTDFYFIEEEDPERVLHLMRQLLLERIPRRFGLDPARDVQVLTPMHRGRVGAEALNESIRLWLNPRGGAIEGAPGEFRVGDKVMQIRNNYDRDVFNGDIDRIVNWDEAAGEVQIRFDSGYQKYTLQDLTELAPAYAITVHKSQGSEYPGVVLPLLTSHYMMLQRNLLYTAVTRAKQLMVIIGSGRALAAAVRNDRLQRRYTLLRERLRKGHAASPEG